MWSMYNKDIIYTLMPCFQYEKLCPQYFAVIVYPLFMYCASRRKQESALGQRFIYCKGLCLSTFEDNTIQI